MAEQQPLEIGTRVRLRSLESFSDAHITRVEELTDHWIALQRPTRNYQPVQLHPGTSVELSVVRTEPPQGVFRAETVVLGETRRPLPLLRIEPPRHWERAQLREFFRVPVNRPVRVRALETGEDAPWLEGHSRDLSGGGCQLALPDAFACGQVLEIELDLPGVIYRMQGTVQRVAEERSEQGVCSVTGIKFRKLPEKQREELIRYAFERQIALRKRGVT